MTVRGKKIWNMVLILMAVLVGLVFLFPVFWMVRSSFMGLEELYANPPGFSAEKCHAAKLSGGFGTDRSVAAASQLLRNNAAVCDGNGDFVQSDSIRIFKI